MYLGTRMATGEVSEVSPCGRVQVPRTHSTSIDQWSLVMRGNDAVERQALSWLGKWKTGTGQTPNRKEPVVEYLRRSSTIGTVRIDGDGVPVGWNEGEGRGGETAPSS